MRYHCPTQVEGNGNRNLCPGMKKISPSDLLSIALAAVREASRCCEAVSEDFRREDHHAKEDESPVTIADYASQALILRRLARETPDLGVVAEEQGDELRERPDMCARVLEFVKPHAPELSAEALPDLLDKGNHPGGPRGTFWTLDPIDGTKGYLRGGQYAVALALIEDGVPVLGVLGCPRYELEPGRQTRVLFYGGRDVPAAMEAAGGGAPRGIQVCGALPRSESRLCESVESAHTAHDRSGLLIREMGLHPESVRMDSQAKYAAVAMGQAALYLRLPVRKGYREKIWDHAAGVAVIEAAGGRVTDLNGNRLDFGCGETLANNRGVLASNTTLHDAAMETLARITPPEAVWE